MRKATIATLMLLLCAVWAMSQQYPSDKESKDTSSGKTTIKGCLSRSGNTYTLTDKSSGTTYQLTGDTSKLSAHVGHEVQIKGSTASAAGTPSSATTQGAEPQLEVASMKHISETCSASGKSGTETPSPSREEKPPMSEKPPTK